MMRAPLDHLRHGIVEVGDLEDVAPEHLEGHEAADLHLMSNGKFMLPLIEADSAFDVLQLYHRGAASVCLEEKSSLGWCDGGQLGLGAFPTPKTILL
jgi:hypothetical protein